MNRSFRTSESQMKASVSVQRRRRTTGDIRTITSKEKEEELGLFMEMRRREKEMHHYANQFQLPLGSKPGSSPIYKTVQSAPTRKSLTDDFLNSDSDKNDYDWLLTPSGTPLLPSLETDSQKIVMSQIGTTNHRPPSLKSRDIRRSVPSNLRPLMTNIPASSMYSVRSGTVRGRTIRVSDSPLATSSNASSERSVNYNALCFDGGELYDGDFGSDRDGPLLGDP